MASEKRGGGMTLIKIAYRNIWRNIRRTTFCFAAVGLAVFFIVFYQSFIGGMTESMRDTVRIFELGHIRAVDAEYEEESERMPSQFPLLEGADWEALAADIKGIPGVKEVFPRITVMATLQESIIKHATLWGIRMDEEKTYHHFNLTDRSDGLVEGRYPERGESECAVGMAFANKAGLSIGDKLPLKTLSAQFSDKMWNPEIVGIFNFDYGKADQQYILVDFDRLQRLLVLGAGTQQLFIYLDKEKESGPIAREVEAILGESAEVTQWRDNYWLAVLEMARPMYVAIFMIFLIVASFLIINTVTMIIHERIKEIGMMGSLGMTRFEIVGVFFLESVFLSVIGAFAGVILGGLLTGIGSNFPLRWTAITGNTFTDMPAGNAIFFQFSLWNLLQGWILGVGVTSLFTLLPSLKSAFVEPVEALRR